MTSVLRSETEVALNDLIALVQDARTTYADAAGQARDGALAALFREVEHERDALEDELADMVRALGDLPHAPDPDRETARRLFERVRAALSPNEDSTLVEECMEAEQALAQRLDQLAEAPPEGLDAARLGRWRSAVTAALGRLAAAQARI